MASQADQFNSELAGNGSLVDREYTRLLGKSGASPVGKSLRDLYRIAGETPRLILGRYSSVGPSAPASSASLRSKILSYSPTHYWPGDMAANTLPSPLDLGSTPIAMNTTGFVTGSPLVADAENSITPSGSFVTSTAPSNGVAYAQATLLAIIYPTAISVDTSIFGHESGGAEDFRISYNTAGNVNLYGYTGMPSAGNMPLNTTSFIAFTSNTAGRLKSFRNGVKLGDNPQGADGFGTGNLGYSIGGFSGGATFPGRICHCAVIPTELSEAQITELYNIAFVGT